MDPVYMFTSAIFIYDYFLTLRHEIQFIWFSRWSYTKVVFLLIRYTAFTSLFLILFNQTFLDLSVETCKVTIPTAAWFLVTQMFLSETVLAIRTWAVWRRNRIIGVGLAALLVATLILQCIWVNTFLSSIQFAPPPYPGFRGCFCTSAPRSWWKNYAAVTGGEAVVLVLMTISAVRSYRSGNISELSNVIHRDGILFYIYLLAVGTANVAMTKSASVNIMTLLSPLMDIMYPVFTLRIVLSIRAVGSRGLSNELHSGYHEELPLVAPRPQDETLCH